MKVKKKIGSGFSPDVSAFLINPGGQRSSVRWMALGKQFNTTPHLWRSHYQLFEWFLRIVGWYLCGVPPNSCHAPAHLDMFPTCMRVASHSKKALVPLNLLKSKENMAKFQICLTVLLFFLFKSKIINYLYCKCLFVNFAFLLALCNLSWPDFSSH